MDPTTTEPEGAAPRIAVWDLPVRLIHWLIVLLVGFSWWTAEEEMLDWHARSGFAILFLLVFRIVWGLIGSSTARFASFVRGPRHILDHLRGRREFVLGHNPLGALSVLALLFMLSLQVGLGLFAADEDGFLSGPLSHLLNEEAVEAVTELHETSFEVLKWLILLHVAAILFYLLVRRKNLVGPMVTGRTIGPRGTPPMTPAPAWRAAVAALAAFASVAALWSAGN
ncbi:MAG TPA: cytochrome b/b6 domain-containing protein [Allosphingosinicella sp.]